MAKKVTVSLIDDVDGESIADETIEFGIDGVSYEIDLSAANAAKLREEMEQWVANARRVSGRRRVKAASTTGGTTKSRVPMDREQTAAIREWARRNGHKVHARGRISADITEAYNKAAKS
ncbi:Lsr2 family protein [Nocardia cyriacigeorgica]|uniref:LSR2 protein n=2 Tax=Nocardia cyriacigeorgica TaxID=135487 RepID=H6RB01_NOCCG|nr:Lsr2 family protein [Nocardia cyriacigeorgica]MBF6085053.1 Lsr2 family protein [Nocardia cyriacigeorgica]MBF6285353.1 Lsr2 family protein [Nocardia cyriacigeorgica]MBF6424709.1 Lsr2 family protein [Nocardia cyriacigeorgica]NEW35241.1 Lsr2 family protein [Nocardia cyriacigeorgica]CCF61240.1 LSR2 protein [Nocardia cyriacigeorgica GUH-2]